MSLDSTIFSSAHLDQARANAIAQQIRPWDVLDPRVLDVLTQVRREIFVPEAHRALTFVDMEIPLPEGQCMLSPKVEARLLQEADLKPSDEVLEIGAGSGHMAALLSHLSQSVITVEKYPSLVQFALSNLSKAGIGNVTVIEGNGLSLDASAAPRLFDVIVVSGGLARAPEGLLNQLKPGGRLLAIVGSAPVMQALLLEKRGSSVLKRGLFETMVPMLEDAPVVSTFQF
ncbi:MAG: protein-L-isoaspartate O-methyltransferase [Betaproteobacteria bacterium]|nr:protein-L-isoaspartate O-methyltransferase [Betaproteobacteria bacterium]